MLLLIILVIKTVLNYILLSLRQAGRSLSFSVQGATFKREFLEKAMTVFHFLLLQNVLATLSELLEMFIIHCWAVARDCTHSLNIQGLTILFGPHFL